MLCPCDGGQGAPAAGLGQSAREQVVVSAVRCRRRRGLRRTRSGSPGAVGSPRVLHCRSCGSLSAGPPARSALRARPGEASILCRPDWAAPPVPMRDDPLQSGGVPLERLPAVRGESHVGARNCLPSMGVRLYELRTHHLRQPQLSCHGHGLHGRSDHRRPSPASNAGGDTARTGACSRRSPQPAPWSLGVGARITANRCTTARPDRDTGGWASVTGIRSARRGRDAWVGQGP